MKVNLSESEWRIMNILWESAPKTIMQLTGELRAVTGWSKSTIITMLGRLEAKGACRHETGARAKEYYPAVPKAQAAIAETESLLNRAYNGSLGLMVNTMLSNKEISSEEIEELYEILRRAEEKL